MGNTIQNIAESIQEEASVKPEWNLNKFQAAACILTSAFIAISLIVWAIHIFL